MKVEEKILAQIKKYDTIIIHRHQRPDPDAYGSQCGLAEIIRETFPTKKVYQVGKNVKGLSWIATPQEISDETYQDALVIVTDTANQPRVDDERYTTGKYLIKIDHHPNDDPYGDICWVDSDASSCSEIITRLVENSNGELQLNAKAARMLYAGIVGDTGRFMYNATTPQTMRAAAKLMEYDFDASQVNRILDEVTPEVARLSAYVLENIKYTPHNAAYIVLDNETMTQFDLEDAGTAQIVPLVGKISSVVCWTVVVQQKDETYRLRIRSKGPVINELAKEYEGGGHPLASGAVLHSLDDLADYLAKLDAIAATASD
ncbi:MAG: bifunctional oligoribonuclease/PAP phosphatase NrnA [Lactobacillus sp.]|nr:bifunctional oligoribonuclease/PAP phosphatase NrnA [Lactobacillus sp.]